MNSYFFVGILITFASLTGFASDFTPGKTVCAYLRDHLIVVQKSSAQVPAIEKSFTFESHMASASFLLNEICDNKLPAISTPLHTVCCVVK